MPSSDRPSRFFVGLLPPPAIQDYANQVIQDLTDRYRMRTAKAPPHITLQPPFLWSIDAISRLHSELQTVAQAQAPVPIQLSGFGVFAPRVLFINVVKTPELLQLQSTLMAHLKQQLDIVDPVSKQRSFAPHLTVASRNVTRQSFKQAWAELAAQAVEFTFLSDRLTLFLHNGQQWHVQAEFPLLL
ncbi:2'-5' RNA ligase family protein [Thermocoleostomius sinensis]|uniref:2'-5' RNA ligase family protein n=1 Tax=Thermocoleostomius sinensis A174 TaxID=2016057 RepID=A0A9E8ZHZ3_9CYAN|nr:2'-5' RNA ligase family protein [Thermocoleostomius sinensis]WAL61628.1 2'-5' RNA ligase family protein [Thermocoleostomius sinensis A174]